MIKTAMFFLTGLLLTATLAYAGSGDLIVDGKIGVGTVTPAAKLHVAGGIIFGKGSFGNTESVSENAWLRDAWLTGQDNTNIRWDAISKTWKRISSGDSTTCFGYNDFGGILHYSDRLYFIKGACGSAAEWTNTDFLNTFVKLSILSTGNVGIGTNTPSFKLDVQGTIGSNNAPVLTSDARFKKNLQPISNPLDKILNLTGLTYEWKTDEYKEKGFAQGRHYGVIAQEIEKVLPEVVNTATDGTKAVAYTEIIPVLIEAIKEQQKRIEQLEKKLAELH
jgi:hypothetical protein